MSLKPQMVKPRPVRVRIPAWVDWRASALAVVAGASTFEPDVSLIYGGAISAVVMVSLVGRFRLGLPDFFAILLFGLACWSHSWSIMPAATEDTAIRIGCSTAIFLALRAAVTTVTKLRIVALGYVGGCLIAVVKLLRENAVTNILHPQTRYGLEGLNYNYLAYALAGALPVLAILWVTPGRIQRKWLVAAGLVVAIGIQLSGTRSAVLAGVFFMVWLVLYRRVPRAGLVVGASAIAVVNYLIVAGPLTLLSRFDYGSRSTGTLSGRLTIWWYARAMWHAHPFLGAGLGTFRATSVVQVAPHDAVLEMGAELGLFGMVLFVGLVIASLTVGMARMDRTLRALLIGGLLAAQAPAFLAGQWGLTSAAFVLIAMLSRITVLVAPELAEVEPPPPSRRSRVKPRSGQAARI